MAILNNFTLPEVEGKQQRYNMLLKQIREIVYNNDDLIANLAKIATILHRGLGFTWTGFYFVRDEGLVIGPFQGPSPSQVSGGCKIAYNNECTVVIDDVEQLAGYLPCGEYDRSEIVVPAFRKGEITLMLKINSNRVKNFTKTDQKNLQQVMHLIEEIL